MLRGFALLGILLMNIQVFGLVSVAYSNPALRPAASPGDIAWWSLVHVFADLKFMAIFAMLFGAGICLQGDRRAGRGMPFWGYWWRRLGLLAIIGLLHAYLIWFGDILFLYAICGISVAWMRNFSARVLFAIGLTLVALGCLFWAGMGQITEWWIALTEVDRDTTLYNPEMGRLETEAYRSGYLQHLPLRARTALTWHLAIIPTYMFWRVTGLMAIGMALYRSGFLEGGFARRHYAVASLAGIGLGIGLSILGVQAYQAHDWDVGYVSFGGTWRNYWGSLLTALGYVATVVFWATKGSPFALLQRVLTAIGRTALSNYLLQSLLATSIFYGHGFGLYEKLGYPEIYGVAIAIWLIQIPLTLLWLKHFRQGPAEWGWRSLCEGRRLPLRALPR